jgi:membrane fusion protein (multidrug efflux system)
MRRIGALLAAMAFFACGRGEPPAPPAPEVGVATAVLGSVPDHREYVGNVEAVNRIEVRARVRGYLLEQLYADGDLVKAGDVLFRIDPSTFDIALAEARGELARTRANAVVAQRELVRAQELYAGKVLSQSLLDARRAERDSSSADVASAEAKVRAAELELSYTTVPAPIAGRVGRALVDVGNLVGSNGDTVLAEIVQIDPIHVYFAPTERDRLDVLRGAREGRIPPERVGNVPIELRLGDGTPYGQTGVIDYVEPTIERTRGTGSVRALVPNPDGVLKPGEFVRVTALFPDVTNAVLVPERAVLEEQGGAYVLVVKGDDTVEYRKVVRGLARDGRQQITSGLTPGERVIADGVQLAPPGTKVVAKPLAETADAKTAR